MGPVRMYLLTTLHLPHYVLIGIMAEIVVTIRMPTNKHCDVTIHLAVRAAKLCKRGIT